MSLLFLVGVAVTTASFLNVFAWLAEYLAAKNIHQGTEHLTRMLRAKMWVKRYSFFGVIGIAMLLLGML